MSRTLFFFALVAVAFATTTTDAGTTTTAAAATTTTAAAVANTTTAAATATTVAPTSAAPVCTAVTPATVLTVATSLFTITGNNLYTQCDHVTMTFVVLPTTTPAPTTTTTTGTTTVAPTTTTAAATTTTTEVTTTTTAAATTTTTAAATTTTGTTTPAPTTPAPTTAYIQLTQPLIGNATNSRQFLFSPSNVGPYTVDVFCGNVNYTCGTFFSSQPTTPLVFAFTSTPPTDLPTFAHNFALALSTASGIDVLQVVNTVVTNTRRRTGFTVSTQLLGTLAKMDPAAAYASVSAAASSGALNTQFQSNIGTTASSFTFGGQTVTVAPATTANPVTPPPGAASSASLSSLLVLVMAAVIALAF